MSDDEPELYGWQERLLRRVERKEQPGKRVWTPLNVSVTPDFIKALHVAGEMRDITLSGYAHRAIARQLAIDLNMPIGEILALAPIPTAYGQNGAFVSRERDTGEGFGEWLWP